MEENFDLFSDGELEELKNKYFEMKDTNITAYFDADEYDRLIDHFFETDDTDNIEVALNFALEQHPGNYDFLLKKAHLFALFGKDELGLQILDEISNFADDFDYFMIRGTILSNLQKYREAIEEYSKAIHDEQDLEEVYSNIAFEYENLEQFDKSIEYLVKVLDINPDNEAALNEVGICYEMSNQSSEAIIFFNNFLDKHPYSKAAWFNLAIGYNSLGKNKQAINAYEFSLAIEENQPSALFNIANIYAGMQEYKKAIEFYSLTLTKEAPDAITYYYMGESYEKQDLFDNALECYINSYEINSDFHEAQLGIARSYFVIGDEEKSYQYIDKAVELGEPYPLFWSIRCLKLDELGFFKLARYAIIQLIKQNPKELLYTIILAILVSNHDLDKSINILKDATVKYKHSDDFAIILYLLGIYQIEIGKEDIGLLNFEQAIILDKEGFQNPVIQAEMTTISHKGVLKLIEKHGLSK